MKKLVLIIMALEVRLRMNASLANPSRGPWRWSAVWGDVPGSSASADKHCKKQRIEGSPKISKEKVATTALIDLQLTLWPH